MGQTASITCDFDGKDLTTNASGTTAFRLTVAAEHIPLAPGANAMFAEAPVKEPHYFCGAACLAGWAAKKVADDKAAAEAAAKKEPDAEE